LEIKAVHKTDPGSADSILKNGFDLGRFGSATAKTGQAHNFGRHALGIYLTEDEGHFRPEDSVSHPWDHRKKGALIFCTVILKNPLLVDMKMDGKFYQKWISDNYGGLSGRRLTNELVKDGHDGIYCKDTGEIVAFNPDQIRIDPEKSRASIATNFKEWLFDIDLDN
jgi:hypothetical protein